jgi:hypothetical protein
MPVTGAWRLAFIAYLRPLRLVPIPLTFALDLNL